MGQWMSVGAVAQHLGIGPCRVRQLCDEQRLRARRNPYNAREVAADSVERFAAARAAKRRVAGDDRE